MYIAAQLKEKNIAEYLIYMWQVEDLIRAHQGNAEQLAARYAEEQRQAVHEWYENLCNMMRTEGVMQQGHLHLNKR